MIVHNLSRQDKTPFRLSHGKSSNFQMSQFYIEHREKKFTIIEQHIVVFSESKSHCSFPRLAGYSLSTALIAFIPLSSSRLV